ncbi:MAG: hypothetical protein M1827_004713 [Pycnora praestabilis]|nr:MAG: hypothetical protein M1827_004713 [Pycnora praestabilis]
MPIHALPPTTVRAIGSSQALTDSCSLVKELVDNALDARASSIFVEISTNTIDLIQVKDNGTGIVPEDRHMVCRRYCTSKIQDLDDLRNVGAQWLGFRGEALASAAEMAGKLSVITRVDGESVAVTMKVGRMGEVEGQERASHPVGTTIRVADFFEHLPVRKQTAIKNSTKTLAKIKQTLQAHALARPAVRFSLKVLKAKNEKDSWTYAPSSDAVLSDAALKVVGKDVAGQCMVVSYTSSEKRLLDITGQNVEVDQTSNVAHGDYHIEAFLPRKNAEPSNINGKGHFLSIDSRPVSCARGHLKQILTLYKSYLRSAISTSKADKIVDPFLCMRISCPRGSYDANVEPAKDDVLFENSSLVLALMEAFFKTVYGELKLVETETISKEKPKAKVRSKGFELLLAKKPPITAQREDSLQTNEKGIVMIEADLNILPDVQNSARCCLSTGTLLSSDSVPSFHQSAGSGVHDLQPADGNLPRTWRSNMYGDDDDAFAESSQQAASHRTETRHEQGEEEEVEEMEGAVRGAAYSNPWVMAKMNATVGSPKRHPGMESVEDAVVSNAQLPTPARERLNSTGVIPVGAFERSVSTLLPTPQQLQYSMSPTRMLIDRQDQILSDEYGMNAGEQARRRYGGGAVDTWVQQALGQHPDASPKSTQLPEDTLRDEETAYPTPQATEARLKNGFVTARDIPLSTPSSHIPGPPKRAWKGAAARNQLYGGLNKPFVSPVNDPDRVWFQIGASRHAKAPKQARGTNIRDALKLSKPIRPENEDREAEEESDPITVPHIGTSHPDVKELLDYEYRKLQANKVRKALLHRVDKDAEALLATGNDIHQVPTNSPYRNRYSAAVAALSTVKDSADIPHMATTSAFTDSDPRAYLIRVQKRSEAENFGGFTKHRLKRAKTVMLPLERTPQDSQLHNLTLIVRTNCEAIEKSATATEVVDEYVRCGELANGLLFVRNDVELKGLEEKLDGLMRGMYRMKGGEGEERADLGFDLETVMERHRASFE